MAVTEVQAVAGRVLLLAMVPALVDRQPLVKALRVVRAPPAISGLVEVAVAKAQQDRTDQRVSPQTEA